MDHNDGGYICRNCGKTAVPLDFDTLDELKAFQRSLSGKVDDSTQTFYQVPILPVDTFTLFRVPVIDLPVGQIADVTEAEWRNGRIEPVGQRRSSSATGGGGSPRYRRRRAVDPRNKGGHPNWSAEEAGVPRYQAVDLARGPQDVRLVHNGCSSIAR